MKIEIRCYIVYYNILYNSACVGNWVYNGLKNNIIESFKYVLFIKIRIKNFGSTFLRKRI